VKIDRLIGIVILLLNRKHCTAGELAGYFEVSERTIYRDIDALGRAGIPVVTLQGSGGGVELMDGFVLDRQIVTAQDITSIVTALKGLSTLFDDDRYVAARDKMESLLPDRARPMHRREQETISVDLLPWGQDSGLRETLSVVKEAALDRRVITFRYGSAKGEITHRTVEPVSLHLKGYSWYCYGYCRLRGEFRLFKLARMRDVVATAEPFEERPSPDPPPYPLDQRLADERKPSEIRLRFTETARARAEESFGFDRVMSTDDGLEVTVFWPIDEWLIGFVMSFGEALTVVAPQELVDEVKRRAAAMLANYGR
jgi:predicted DNA-binding transcriptional regulator YafY